MATAFVSQFRGSELGSFLAHLMIQESVMTQVLEKPLALEKVTILRVDIQKTQEE